MFLDRLIALTGKNLKLFFRSRASSSAVVLIPFFVVMLAGFAFDSSGLNNIQVGVYSDSYSDFTNGIVSSFDGSGFSSRVYESGEACVDSIKYSESQICVIFPSNLNPDVSEEDIVFYVDYSRANLAYNLVAEVEKDVLLETSVVGEGIAQGLIDSLESVKDALPAVSDSIDEAYSEAVESRDITSGLDVPGEDIFSIIHDLEGIKEDLNGTGFEDDVNEVIVDLQSIEEETDQFSDEFDDAFDKQVVVVQKLNDASKTLNGVIISLNSYKAVGAGDVVSPIGTRLEAIDVDSTNRDYIVPIILSLIGLFGSILLTSTIVLRNKKTRAFFRNFMAPVSNFTFVLSIYLACLIILLMQFVFIFAGIQYVLRIDIIPFLGPLILVFFVSLSVFIAIGMFIGYLFRSEETVIFASMIVAALLMFFSNIILPLENITGGIAKVLKFNPLVVSNLALKKVILFGFGVDSVVYELQILAGFFVFFFLVSCLMRSMTRRIL